MRVSSGSTAARLVPAPGSRSGRLRTRWWARPRLPCSRRKDRASSSLGESKSQFADQFGTVADALRRTTEHLRGEDQQRIAGLTETVARQVDQVANYLRSKDAQAMRADIENLARRQPALMLGGALVLGLDRGPVPEELAAELRP